MLVIKTRSNNKLQESLVEFRRARQRLEACTLKHRLYDDYMSDGKEADSDESDDDKEADHRLYDDDKPIPQAKQMQRRVDRRGLQTHSGRRP